MSASASRGRRPARCRGATLPALAAVVALGSTCTQALVNGGLEFRHPAAGALLVHPVRSRLLLLVRLCPESGRTAYRDDLRDLLGRIIESAAAGVTEES